MSTDDLTLDLRQVWHVETSADARTRVVVVRRDDRWEVRALRFGELRTELVSAHDDGRDAIRVARDVLGG